VLFFSREGALQVSQQTPNKRFRPLACLVEQPFMATRGDCVHVRTFDHEKVVPFWSVGITGLYLTRLFLFSFFFCLTRLQSTITAFGFVLATARPEARWKAYFYSLPTRYL